MATTPHDKKGESDPSIGKDARAIDDTSSSPRDNKATVDKLARRAEQLRAAQQKRRLAIKATGGKVVQVELTKEQFDALIDCQLRQNGPVEGFYIRALLTGAKFLANSGRPRGQKVRAN